MQPTDVSLAGETDAAADDTTASADIAASANADTLTNTNTISTGPVVTPISTSAASIAIEPTQVVAAPPIPVLNPDYQPCVRVRDVEKDRPQLGSRQRKNEFEPYSNGDITNISQYTAAFIELPASSSSSTPKLGVALAKPYDYSHIPLPAWFDKAQVHAIEKVALPEYFQATGRKADRLSKEYRMYRDFMIDTYQKNPSYYLSISECKAELGIDLLSVVRIHSFLEHAGLINQQLDPRRRIFDPYIDSEPDAQVTEPGTQRDFDVAEAEIQFIRNLIYEEKPTQLKKSRWDVSIQCDTDPDIRTIFPCSTCGVDCSDVRYQSFKYKDFQVCPECFLEGKFTANTWKGEFLRVEKSESDDMDDDWREDETLRLLEGIDRYDDDWLAISEHVGSRTKEQCIIQFLQLPITDPFLSAKLSEKELEELPFGAQPNPVMALIAFLSAHVNPGIGSSAARRAIKELLNSRHDTEDAMDVDEQENQPLSPECIKRAVIGALESAVEQAKKLASYESEEIQHWTRLAVKTMIDKLDLKVQQYDDQENFLDNELKELGKQSVSLMNSLEALTKQYPLANASASASASASVAANEDSSGLKSSSSSIDTPQGNSSEAPMMGVSEAQIPSVAEQTIETPIQHN
ncbi:SWIRM domain-containing protein [Dichotomocladium elegans]|nr:SWIRM domain-containing protein [Dichotomocladium elegans]